MTTFSPESRAVLKTSMGDITIEFLTDKAPRTCEHFVRLARKGFYEGLTFHRIIKDFMVQGGCPKGDGTGSPGFTIRAEFNDTPHVKGIVSMARGNDPHSAGSQFFIVHGEARYLDSRYTAFAKVVEGLKVLDKIASVPVEENRYREVSKPREPVFINSVVLEGIEFDANDNAEPQQPQQQQQQRNDAGRSEQGQGQGQRERGEQRPAEPRSSEPRSTEPRSTEPAPSAAHDEDDDEADEPEESDDEPETGRPSAARESDDDADEGGAPAGNGGGKPAGGSQGSGGGSRGRGRRGRRGRRPGGKKD